MRLTDFGTLTFDCYGTLIDWESGIAAVLTDWAARAGLEADAEALLAAFARHETRLQQAHPTMLYPALLAHVHHAIAADFGAAASEADAAAFGASVGDWPAFADSAEALGYLGAHYRLVILSNVDRASFARSNARLGVTFEAVYTAEDIGSYKPDPQNFRYLIARLAERGIAKDEILHTAQSPYHDIAPARAAGLATNWIDRRRGKAGAGATPQLAARADFEHASLAAFVERHRAARAAG